MPTMRQQLPHDPLIYARMLAALAIGFWVVLGGDVVAPGAFATIGVLAGTAVVLVLAERRRGGPYRLTDYPVAALGADVVAASLWMVATALDPGSVAAGLVVVVGAMATFRIGRRGAAFTVGVYLLGRVASELIRIGDGDRTPLNQLAGDVVITIVALVILTAVVESYRHERSRGLRALARAKAFERAAGSLSSATDPEDVLAAIPVQALDLVDARHAVLILHRQADFAIVSGAGLGAGVVGVRGPATGGLVGIVVRERRTTQVPDFQALTDAPAAVRALGLRAAVALPIVMHGEISAILLVARLELRPFDEDELAALESFVAHAATALANARTIMQARRIEIVGRSVGEATAVEVLERIADEAVALFNAEFVLSAIIDEGMQVVRAFGEAAPLTGRVGVALGPALRELVHRRALIVVTDYQPEYAAQAPAGVVGVQVAIAAGVHGMMLAPIIVNDRVAAALVVGTTDPHRSFDVIDRQGILALGALGASALRGAAIRAEHERRIQRLGALNELATKTAVVHDPAVIAALAHQTVRELVTFDSFYIARYDPQRRLFEFLLEVDGERVREGESFRPLGTGPTSQVVLTGESYVSRTSGEPVQRPGIMSGGTTRRSGSAVHVPMKMRGETVGVLSAQSYRSGVFDDEDVAILQSLGNLVASAFENSEHHARLRELYLASVRALAAAVDARDPYTRSHSARVAALSRIIALEMALPPDEIRQVQLSALLHDIGKIGIPDAILNKPSALTPEEWVIMKTHSALGGSILAAVEPLAELVPIVRAHHERYDGAGYPDGLAGSAVPFGAYIVQAADAYEVIVSRRAYKAAQSVDHAVAELQRCSGSQFHPEVVAAFLRVIERDRSQGTAHLSDVGLIERENIDDVPGPGPLVERMAASSQTHTRQIAMLQRLASEISAVLDVDELASRLLGIICDSMGYDSGFLRTVDSGGDLVIRAAVGLSAEFVGQRLSAGTGVSWWVMEHSRLQNVADVRDDARYVGSPDTRSLLAVPLRSGDERLGVVGIESTRVAAFSAEDEALLTAVSHQVTAAVRVAGLHQAAMTLAATDPLTGLPNRRVFFEHVAAGLRRAELEAAPLSVAMIDVNELKQLNDEYGHAAGDRALIRIGGILTGGVRQSDLVTRIGGDEFAIVFPGAPLLAAERIMRRLADDVACAIMPGGQALPTIAWGIAPAPPEPTSVDALIDAADRAMYRQKRLGSQRAGDVSAS